MSKLPKGKKIRARAFYFTLFLICAVIFLSFLFAFLWPPVWSPDYLIAILGMAPILLIWFFALLMSFRKVLCILSDDRLYYLMPKNYGMEFAVLSGNKRTVSAKAGAIRYSDIQTCEYIPRDFNLILQPHGGPAPCVVLHGEGFALTIVGVGKRFIKQVETAQRSVSGSDSAENNAAAPADTEITQQVRCGLWKEIWQCFESGALEDAFDTCKIIRMEGDEDLDTIDIWVERNGHEIDFNMDSCSIYMSSPDNDTEQTISYAHAAGLETLFSAIREFIASNSE